eukprot:c31780_g1_i1 orf=1-252(-)
MAGPFTQSPNKLAFIALQSPPAILQFQHLFIGVIFCAFYLWELDRVLNFRVLNFSTQEALFIFPYRTGPPFPLFFPTVSNIMSF